MLYWNVRSLGGNVGVFFVNKARTRAFVSRMYALLKHVWG